MSREERFARRLCRVLDRSTDDLAPDIVERLRASRCRAVAAQAVPAHAPLRVKVGADGTAAVGGIPHPLRTLFAICALLFGIALAYYWNAFEQVEAAQEIDLALLADELPPKAYLDPGFQAWLSHYAQLAR